MTASIFISACGGKISQCYIDASEGRGSKRAQQEVPGGASYETFVADQMLTTYQRVMPGSHRYFWRTAQGDEVDLPLDLGPRRVAFEIKLHSAPGPQDVQGLRRCLRDLGLARGYVLHNGRERYSLGAGVMALPAAEVLAHPRELTKL